MEKTRKQRKAASQRIRTDISAGQESKTGCKLLYLFELSGT